MGLLQSCIARKNRVGIADEEVETYEIVAKDMVEKKGGVAFGLTFAAEEAPKTPPPRLVEDKKQEFEKWRETQKRTQAIKQDRAQQNREEAMTKKMIEVAHKETERLEKYVNVGAEKLM